MILQALYDYYQRKASDPESGIPALGFSWEAIPFIVVIDRKGNFVSIEDTRSGEGKNKRARKFLVPQGPKRASGIRANLLWDNSEYALGANPRGRSDIAERSKAFRDEILRVLPARAATPEVEALLTFLEGNPSQTIESIPSETQNWKDLLETNANVTFRILGADGIVSDSFRAAIARSAEGAGDDAPCLVSGEKGSVELTHPSIKGVRGAQSSGASLVSFNSDAYTSFGKKQNNNAPVSKESTFAYTTALNALLGAGSTNKIQIGDATTVFWSQKKSSFEDAFSSFFVLPQKDNPDEDVLAVRALYETIRSGAVIPDAHMRFFVLGLSPNAARISVRFWHQGTIGELSHRLKSHFDDLKIERSSKDIGRYSLFWILVEIASERKIDNVPPNLAGSIMRSILEGTPYPATLLQQTMRRIRADQTVSRMRAAILKACLNRFQRTHPSKEKEITVALDLDNNNPGYRLGRLFAALEKIQEDANPGLNATIRDRFYGAASASPVTAFPQLLKLKNHHLKKMDNPRFVGAHEKRLTEIMSGLPTSMPAHLKMDDQARFAIGYYHQRQAFFTKATPTDSSKDDTNTPDESKKNHD